MSEYEYRVVVFYCLENTIHKSQKAAGRFFPAYEYTGCYFSRRNDSLARRVCERSKTRRIEAHIKPDGSQPFELERTRSMHYSLFNLVAYFELAQLAEHVNIDLWRYRTKEGAGIKTAFDFLLPYFQDQPWPYPQITPMHHEYDILEKLLRIASIKYQDGQYVDLLHDMSLLHSADRLALLYPVCDK
ncbi:MAG: alginate lyase family protein [candidate division KSB1 bacterium]|nr:alginate lyase family protein [candidate division KSB1 bacterium]